MHGTARGSAHDGGCFSVEDWTHPEQMQACAQPLAMSFLFIVVTMRQLDKWSQERNDYTNVVSSFGLTISLYYS